MNFEMKHIVTNGPIDAQTIKGYKQDGWRFLKSEFAHIIEYPHAMETDMVTFFTRPATQKLSVSDLQQQVNQLLDEKGFSLQMETLRNVAGEEQLLYYLGALLATEPAELIDAVKKQKGTDAILEEAADTIIRAMNIFIVLDADADYIIGKKMEKNMGRSYLYGHGEGK